MGYLDEAIREHLELKRQRGVPESEIEREQAEAFGPLAVDEQVPESVAERHDTGEHQPVTTEPEVEPAAGHGDQGQPTEAFSLEELEAEMASDGPRPEQPVELDPPLREEIERAWNGPSDESHEALPQDPDGEGDVLEGTPDFLQETPEHDRLWFEQKPPKDFDF